MIQPNSPLFYMAADETEPRFATFAQRHRFEDKTALNAWLEGRDPANVTIDEVFADEFGIVWDSHETFQVPKKYYGDNREMGITVFASFEARNEAIAWLKEMGYRYFTTYKDAMGPGLSWAWRCGPQIRPSARARLSSTQRARQDQRTRADFQRSLFRNPAYDLVNEPIIEPWYA